MELLYRGFDGLDLSLQGQISAAFLEELEAAKEHAQKSNAPTVLFWNDLKLEVNETGSRGGYAFTASTGPLGATWFFKKPNARDPWGVRVSCASFNLALNGLGGARAQLYDTLRALEVDLVPGGESLSRVDYAMDFLAPEFVLVPEHFVMHSNAGWAEHSEQLPEVVVHGRSVRVTSVTVGKMPGRQIIIYDKRADVIAKHKVGWWEIWNASRARSGEPPLKQDDPTESRIWRVEVRAGKHYLKERWNIRTWSDLDNRLGDMFAASIEAIRHAQPTRDSNRSRWPNSELWNRVVDEVQTDLFEMRQWADPDLVKSVQKDALNDLLARQMLGLMVNRAALRGVQFPQLRAFALSIGDELAREVSNSPSRIGDKLARTVNRYDLGI